MGRRALHKVIRGVTCPPHCVSLKRRARLVLELPLGEPYRRASAPGLGTTAAASRVSGVRNGTSRAGARPQPAHRGTAGRARSAVAPQRFTRRCTRGHRCEPRPAIEGRGHSGRRDRRVRRGRDCGAGTPPSSRDGRRSVAVVDDWVRQAVPLLRSSRRPARTGWARASHLAMPTLPAPGSEFIKSLTTRVSCIPAITTRVPDDTLSSYSLRRARRCLTLPLHLVAPRRARPKRGSWMLPRSTCLRCRRSIAVNRDGAMRSHFCPHYHTCETETCHDCWTTRQSAATPDEAPAPPCDGATQSPSHPSESR